MGVTNFHLYVQGSIPNQGLQPKTFRATSSDVDEYTHRSRFLSGDYLIHFLDGLRAMVVPLEGRSANKAGFVMG
jgi:hypothetical protein